MKQTLLSVKNVNYTASKQLKKTSAFFPQFLQHFATCSTCFLPGACITPRCGACTALCTAANVTCYFNLSRFTLQTCWHLKLPHKVMWSLAICQHIDDTMRPEVCQFTSILMYGRPRAYFIRGLTCLPVINRFLHSSGLFVVEKSRLLL